MARQGISGAAVAAAAVGLYLIYAGIRGVPFVAGLRELASGTLPAETPQDTGGVEGGAGKAGRRASGLTRPVSGAVGDRFGAPRPGGRLHKGIDIPAATGTPIAAAAAGTVTGRGFNAGAGNYVQLDHAEGLRTKYFHLSRFNVSHGQQVSAGQVIGFVGSTGSSSGPHLHFEVWEGGAARDPLLYLAG